MEALSITAEDIARFNNYKAQRDRSQKKYYEKTCKIRSDMTEEEKALAQQRIQKRRDNAKAQYIHMKQIKATMDQQSS
jgi:hypothetical protein